MYGCAHMHLSTHATTWPFINLYDPFWGPGMETVLSSVYWAAVFSLKLWQKVYFEFGYRAGRKERRLTLGKILHLKSTMSLIDMDSYSKKDNFLIFFFNVPPSSPIMRNVSVCNDACLLSKMFVRLYWMCFLLVVWWCDFFFYFLVCFDQCALFLYTQTKNVTRPFLTFKNT